MKPLSVVQLCMGSAVGGVCSTIGLLDARLRSEGHISKLLCTPQVCCPDTIPRCTSDHGTEVFKLRRLRRSIHPVHDLRALLEIRSLLRGIRPDVLITRTSKGGVIGRIGGRAAGVRTIIHFVHGFAFSENTPPLSAAIYRGIEFFCGHFCDRIVSVNDEDRESAVRHRIYPEGKILTIKNGVDVARFSISVNKTEYLAELGFPANSRLVVFASRLAAQKDPFTLVDAARAIVSELPEARICIAGTGSESQRLREYVEQAQLAGVVHLLGHRDDIPQLLAAADVFVALSFFEGLPKNVLEAMAAGLPIVATNVKGSRELVRDKVNGLLVPVRNAEATADAIIWLLNHPEETAVMCETNRRVIEDHYSAERMIDSTVELVRKLSRTDLFRRQ